MNDFVELLLNEIRSVIEGLIGIAPEVNLKEKSDKIKDISPPYVKIMADVKPKGEIVFIISPKFATAVSDMMLGGEGIAKDEVNEDDLDATKEIVSNILGSLSTTLEAQENIENLNFEIKDASFIETNENFNEYVYMINFECKINDINENCYVLMDKDLKNILEPTTEDNEHQNSVAVHNTEEIKQIEMLMDIKLQVRVRIGKKTMLLKDIINMDIGSIVELDQLANEPLDILIDDKKIGEGEVVIVDGNFGIQITSIGTKAERLNSMKK
ncbi:flagellar motor switch protein FliY [Caminibacter sp.]